VRLKSYFYNQVTVMGAVSSPGRFPLQAGDTVLDALFKAGGLSFGRQGGVAPGRVIKIYRDRLGQKDRTTLTPDEILERLTRDGKIERWDEILIPVEKFTMGGDLSINVPVKPNDIVYVEPGGAVMVTGNVHRPRVVFLGPSLRTVVHALTECGGMQYRAANKIEVVRTLADGSAESYFLDGRRMMRRKDRDFMLQNGDQVFVYRDNWRTFVGLLGSIFSAGVNTGVSATYSPVN